MTFAIVITILNAACSAALLVMLAVLNRVVTRRLELQRDSTNRIALKRLNAHWQCIDDARRRLDEHENSHFRPLNGGHTMGDHT